jgi:malate dehydrogenase (quinone)
MPGLTFNVTPSPGGTCCLGNAEMDLEAIATRLDCKVDRERLKCELHGTETQNGGKRRASMLKNAA